MANVVERPGAAATAACTGRSARTMSGPFTPSSTHVPRPCAAHGSPRRLRRATLSKRNGAQARSRGGRAPRARRGPDQDWRIRVGHPPDATILDIKRAAPDPHRSRCAGYRRPDRSALYGRHRRQAQLPIAEPRFSPCGGTYNHLARIAKGLRGARAWMARLARMRSRHGVNPWNFRPQKRPRGCIRAWMGRPKSASFRASSNALSPRQEFPWAKTRFPRRFR